MRRNKGFTLIELMIVVAVIAILATMSLFGLRRAQAAARDTARQSIMRGVQTALENYYGDVGYYPTSANFNELLTTPLATYIPTDPVDPSRGCSATHGATGPWLPCGTVLLPSYAYTPGAGTTPQSYTLTLSKESGGTNTFTNPQ